MDKQSPPFVMADKEQIDKGISRQFLGYGPELMPIKVWFEEGTVGYQYDHPHTQVTYVESGEFESTIDGEANDGDAKILRAGDSFYVAPHKTHGAVCKKAGALIDIFSPQREDFMKGKD